MTLKFVVLLTFPDGVTTLILPVTAPTGTVTLILVDELLLIAAAAPPMVTFESPTQVGALDGHGGPRRTRSWREARDRRCFSDHEALLGAGVLARVVVEVTRVVSGEAVRSRLTRMP